MVREGGSVGGRDGGRRDEAGGGREREGKEGFGVREG